MTDEVKIAIVAYIHGIGFLTLNPLDGSWSDADGLNHPYTAQIARQCREAAFSALEHASGSTSTGGDLETLIHPPGGSDDYAWVLEDLAGL